jgi:hypothetical protein
VAERERRTPVRTENSRRRKCSIGGHAPYRCLYC